MTEFSAGAATYVVTCYRAGLQASNRVTVNWTLATPQVSLILAPDGQTFTSYIGTAVLQWHANVTPCVASGGSPGDGWAGTLAASGTRTVTETSAGSYTYMLACGSGAQTATTQFALEFLGPAAHIIASGGITTANIGQSISLSAFGQGLNCATGGGVAGDGWAGTLPDAETIIDKSVTEITPGSYTYTFSCTANGLAASASITLTFLSAPPSVVLNYSTGGQQYPKVGFTVLPLSWISTVAPCEFAVNGYVNETSSGYPGQASYLDQQYVIGPYTYTVTCGSPGMTATASTTVFWSGTPQVSLQVNGSTQVLGTPFSVAWNGNLTPCTAIGGTPGDGWSGNSAQAQGNVQVTETVPGTYTYGITCGSAGQTATASTSVTFAAGPAYATLSASASTGSIGGPPVVLSWSSNTSPCTRSGTTGYWGNLQSSGSTGSDSVLEGIPGTYTYVIRCGSGANTTATAQAAVTFTGQPRPMVSASNGYPVAGEPFTLSWSTANSYGPCLASGGAPSDGWYGLAEPLPASGTMQVVEPTAGFYYYGLLCGGPYISVMVLPNPSAAPGTYHPSGQLDLPTLVIGGVIFSNISVISSVRTLVGSLAVKA